MNGRCGNVPKEPGLKPSLSQSCREPQGNRQEEQCENSYWGFQKEVGLTWPSNREVNFGTETKGVETRALCKTNEGSGSQEELGVLEIPKTKFRLMPLLLAGHQNLLLRISHSLIMRHGKVKLLLTEMLPSW